MATPEMESRCIYCRSGGPFSAEHMIPAGLGADDKRFLLRDMVCKVCNTNVFSPLELEWLRNSPTAIARIFMQEKGRQRGSKRQSPKLGAGQKVVITPEGYTAEADIGYRGRATILPQLILVDERRCNVAGSDKEGFGAFISALRRLLGPSVVCACRSASAEKSRFEITMFVWVDDEYVAQDQAAAAALPDACLLHFPIEPDTEGKHGQNSRIFQRGDGQLVLRLRSEVLPGRALTSFRKVTEQLDLSALQESEIQNPLVSLNMSFRLDVTGRVLAKTGLNILAHVLGADYVGHPEFGEIKRAISTGEPVIAPFPDHAKIPFRTLFSGLPDTHHAFLLAAHPWHGGTCGIGLVSRLYGSQIEMVNLARGLPYPMFSFPIIFTVDYLAHRIQQYGLMEFMCTYPVSGPPDAPNQAGEAFR